jgi:peptide methionine sulfoxide reductase MsrB
MLVCAKCRGNLGNVLREEGFNIPTNERHYINGVSLNFDHENARNTMPKQG